MSRYWYEIIKSYDKQDDFSFGADIGKEEILKFLKKGRITWAYSPPEAELVLPEKNKYKTNFPRNYFNYIPSNKVNVISRYFEENEWYELKYDNFTYIVQVSFVSSSYLHTKNCIYSSTLKKEDQDWYIDKIDFESVIKLASNDRRILESFIEATDVVANPSLSILAKEKGFVLKTKFIDLVHGEEFEVASGNYTVNKKGYLYVPVVSKINFSNKTARIFDGEGWAKIVKKFKIGDRVKVLDTNISYKETVGKIGTITEISLVPSYSYRVDVGEGYPAIWSKVEEVEEIKGKMENVPYSIEDTKIWIGGDESLFKKIEGAATYLGYSPAYSLIIRPQGIIFLTFTNDKARGKEIRFGTSKKAYDDCSKREISPGQLGIEEKSPIRIAKLPDIEPNNPNSVLYTGYDTFYGASRYALFPEEGYILKTTYLEDFDKKQSKLLEHSSKNSLDTTVFNIKSANTELINHTETIFF